MNRIRSLIIGLLLTLAACEGCAGTTTATRLQTAQTVTAGAAVLCAQIPALASQGLTEEEVAPLVGLCGDLVSGLGHALELARLRALKAEEAGTGSPAAAPPTPTGDSPDVTLYWPMPRWPSCSGWWPTWTLALPYPPHFDPFIGRHA